MAITMGDPVGIGPEVVLKALLVQSASRRERYLVVGDLALLERTRDACRLPLALEARSARGRSSGAGAVSVLDIGPVGAGLEVGRVSAAAGEAAWLAIEEAVRICLAGQAAALVTAPINKVSLDLAGRGHEGHTEILQRLTGSPWSLTVFLLGAVRAVFFTRHLSLGEAVAAVKAEPLAETLVRFKEASPVLGLDDPLVGVAALNPHAGEGGLFGREEMEHIEPGIVLARKRGVRVEGPIPADSIFHQAKGGRYDAILGLYHDQVAAVMKGVDFHRVVSVTLGLPFLRFSVDHGTAYDIAGQNVADATNMAAVLDEAERVLRGEVPV